MPNTPKFSILYLMIDIKGQRVSWKGLRFDANQCMDVDVQNQIITLTLGLGGRYTTIGHEWHRARPD